MDDIRDIFRGELETYIGITREHLDRYLSPEGSAAHLDSPAVYAHAMKGVAASVNAWGLAWLGEDFDALYDLARSLHQNEPERARHIVGFIHESIPHWKEMAKLSLDGELDAAFARYREVRSTAETHWGGYLPSRSELPPEKSEEPSKPEAEAEPTEAKPQLSPEGEAADGTRYFKPGRLSAGLARSVSQPKLRITPTEEPAAPKPETGKSEPEVEKTKTVFVSTGAAGAARRVAIPQLKVIKEEETSFWNALEEECVSAPADEATEQVKSKPPITEVPSIAKHLIAPTFQVTSQEPSEWEELILPASFSAASSQESQSSQDSQTSQDSQSAEDDLVEIFRTEAQGYLEEITADFAQLQTNLRSEESWAELRRLCHTLKGSSAIVGLDNVSEHGKAAEQLARTALEDSSARTQAQLSAIGEIIWVIASLLKLPWTHQSAPANSLDPDLANAFCYDAVEQLDSLEAALLAWERGDAAETQRRAAYRAYHTLKGAANSIGLSALGANLHLLEDLMEHTTGVADKERFSFFLQTVDQLRQFATALQRDSSTQWPHSWDETVARLTVAATVSIPEPEAPPTETVAAQEAPSAEAPDSKAEDHDLIRAFSFDARDQSHLCELAVLAWERGQAPSEQMPAIYRAFHTLKGSANSVGLERIGQECHAVAALIDNLIQTGQTEIAPAPLVAFLLTAVDQISSFGELLEREPKAEWPHDWEGEVSRLSSSSPSGSASEEDAVVAEENLAEEQLAKPEELPAVVAVPSPAVAELEAAAPAVDYIRVKSASVHQLLNQVGELVVERNRFSAKLDRAIQLRQLLADNRRHLLRLVENFQDSFEYSNTRRRAVPGHGFGYAGSSGSAAEFSELEMDRYDEFNMLSRALTEVADDLGQVTVEMESLIESFRVDEKRFATNSRRMQEDITSLTSQPIEGLFRRLERSFRDALQVAQKEAVLRFEGAHATLDRSIIERLYSPLLHLVRNSVSHGIETPAQREAAGKDRKGKVIVSASQSSNQIIITVRDDGMGISPEAVLNRARERGLVSHDKSSLSHDEVLALLFTSGFSTAQEITQVAGRGVGMDVVKREIEELKGSVSAEWTVGAGTTWKIQLPLTLAVSEAIIVELAGQEYALPLNFTASGLLVEPRRITTEGGTEHYTLPDGQSLPLIRLARIFNQQGKEEDLRAVILALGDARAVLVVDRVLARREIVVKSLGPLFAGHALLEGATIDSQGRPLLILSAPALLRIAAAGFAGPTSTPAEPALPVTPDRSANARITALVVDDSLSVRTVQNRLLSDLGCEVLLANDGLAALEKLRQQKADIIFTDLEMPRMNGYDLISAVRAHAELNRIPMVLVTSRSAQKHLDKALQLGVNACLTKPFTRDDLAAMLSKYAGYVPAGAQAS